MIEFRKHFVKKGAAKVRCRYSKNVHINGKACITIYAKDYASQLRPIFGDQVQNNTEFQTDYFEKDRVCLFEDSPLYQAALKYAV